MQVTTTQEPLALLAKSRIVQLGVHLTLDNPMAIYSRNPQADLKLVCFVHFPPSHVDVRRQNT